MSSLDRHARVTKLCNAIKVTSKRRSQDIVENTETQFRIEKNKIIKEQKEKLDIDFANKLDKYSAQKRMSNFHIKSVKRVTLSTNKD